jgi:hypothetical protein
MFNVNQITSELAKMADPMLQKYAAMHKDDPYTVALAVGESNRRKAMRAGAQAKMAGMQQPKVVDQDIAGMAAVDPMGNVTGALPEDIGIGRLAAPNMQRMAGGGITGYAGDEGSVTRMSGTDLFDKALDTEGITDPLRRAFAKAIHGQESSGKAHAKTSNRGAAGPMQVRGPAWKDVASPDMDPKNPFDNMRAGIRYAMKGFDAAGGNPVLAGAHYYGGKGGMDKLVEGKEVSDPKNPNAPTTAGYGKSIAERMMRFLPVGSAEAATVEKAMSSVPTAKAAPVAPAAPAGEDKRAWYDRYRDLAMSGEAQKALLHGVQDVPAALLGTPVDLSYSIANALGRKEIPNEKPVMGSQWLKEKFGQMGIRAPEATNPDLQNIRAATTGVASLYNPLSEAATTGKMTKAGIEALRKENTAAAINAARTEAETTGALSSEAKLAEDAEAARRAALSAEPPTKAAAIQQANELAQARRAPVGKDLNPVGEASLLAGTELPLPSGATAPAATTPAVSPQNVPVDQEGIAQILEANKDKPTTAPSGFGGFFNDPMGILGLQLMASKNPNLLGALGEAGQGTAKYMSDLRKAEAEQGYTSAKGAEAKALADLYNRGAKDRNMQLEAEKLVQQHMEKWATGPGKLASLQDKNAGAAEEERIRQSIYRQLGITPATMVAQQQVPSAAGWGQATVR